MHHAQGFLQAMTRNIGHEQLFSLESSSERFRNSFSRGWISREVRRARKPAALLLCQYLHKQYYVRYWNNGKLSMIVKCLVNLPVGIQTFYDENGNISEQVDYSKKFGRVSPQDVLSILEREKVISLSEEISRRASSEGFEFSFNLNYDEKTKIWLADINLDFKKGIAEDTFNSSRKFVHYKIDGQTGRILDISYDEVDFW